VEKTSMNQRLLTGLGIAVLAVLVAACSSGSAPATAPVPQDPKALQIAAKDLKFSTASLSAAADTSFSIVFDNQEGAPHNVAIYKDDGLTQRVFGPDPFSGPKAETYAVPALAAGTYVFICDVHKEMKGTLTIQ
jgi:plastocyanin